MRFEFECPVSYTVYGTACFNVEAETEEEALGKLEEDYWDYEEDIEVDGTDNYDYQVNDAICTNSLPKVKELPILHIAQWEDFDEQN